MSRVEFDNLIVDYSTQGYPYWINISTPGSLINFDHHSLELLIAHYKKQNEILKMQCLIT